MRVIFKVWCQASYDTIINVPEDFESWEKSKQVEYIKDHLSDAPLGTLEYLPDSDDYDEEDDFTIVD